ncbi:hypothetical protein LXA43DRAFT_1067996 [Ganoderma leucocontextum]|nr:hypothetical protein LXA43DRAFT_1067996 [Ganoderma leucocontextum]
MSSFDLSQPHMYHWLQRCLYCLTVLPVWRKVDRKRKNSYGYYYYVACDECREPDPKRPPSTRTAYFRRIPHDAVEVLPPAPVQHTPASSRRFWSPHASVIPRSTSSSSSSQSGRSEAPHTHSGLLCSLLTCNSRRISRHCLSRACRKHCLEAGGCPARGHDAVAFDFDSRSRSSSPEIRYPTEPGRRHPIHSSMPRSRSNARSSIHVPPIAGPSNPRAPTSIEDSASASMLSPSPTLSSPGCPYTIAFPPMRHISDMASSTSEPFVHLSARARGKRPRARTPSDVIDLTLDSPPLVKKRRLYSP